MLDVEPDKTLQFQLAVYEEINDALQAGTTCTFKVTGECMIPVLHDNDMLQVARKPYYPGDILVYYCPFQQSKLAHRFLGTVFTGTTTKFLFMADNAEKPDVLIQTELVLGSVVSVNQAAFRVPLKARIVAFAKYLYWVSVLFLKKLFG